MTLLGLILVPLIIQGYSIEAYGIIMIARFFIPLFLMSVIDFGLGEITSIAVSSYRENRKKYFLKNKLLIIFILLLLIGITAGFFLFLLSSQIPSLFSLSGENYDNFSSLIKYTSFLQPILFLLLFFEGILKGFEKFLPLRIIELFSSIIYFLLALYFLQVNLNFIYIAYAFLISLFFRFLFSLFAAIYLLKNRNLGYFLFNKKDIYWIKERGFEFFKNRLINNIQPYFGSFTVSILIGPIALGLYDAIIRLARLGKVFIGVMVSSAIPVSARLFSRDDDQTFANIGGNGSLVLSIICTYPIIFIIFFSDMILGIWLGDEFSQYGIWLSIMMIVPLISSINGFLQTLLVADKQAFKRYNSLIFFQTIFQIFFSLIIFFFFDLSFYSFILGQTFASIVVAVPIFNLTREVLKTPHDFNLSLFTNLLTSSIFSLILFILFGELVKANILIAMAVFLISFLLIIFINIFFIIPTASRNEFFNFVKINFKS